MSTKKTKKESGAIGFSSQYWEENYNEPEEMDGIVNAGQHAKYISAFFAVDYVDISSVIDLGFGLGHLFEEVLKEFMPYRAMGIEPSTYAFDRVKERKISPCDSTKLTLKKWDLVTWSESIHKKSKWYDLGLCTSVFQYLTDKELKKVIPMMSKQMKYLYLSVPTDYELQRQVSDLEFKDRYAIHRTKRDYLELLRPHFTIIGSRVLESKFHFNEETTHFTDYLYRRL
ncbi:MAG: hypothetical protein CME63_17170 [Halobacteriovoraceae bacterium]|nr:hypothetical protein [Halobacteriovoraceae bacterium]MBC99478.1 hypothetical protein [Halobacteriovoraceae bacterium]|tara:strand:+ start:231901 stop:232584 length:684 start_codon:yes stop_codon:yes gene_type:complete